MSLEWMLSLAIIAIVVAATIVIERLNRAHARRTAEVLAQIDQVLEQLRSERREAA